MLLYNEEIFSINENLTITEEFIGNNKSLLITVGDIFNNPHDVVNFFNTIPQQDNIKNNPREIRGFFPGYQTYLRYDFFNLNNFVSFILNNYYGFSTRSINFSYQCAFTNKKVYKQSTYPHCDDGGMAGNIFLNTQEEIEEKKTGTAFYRLKETGEECFFPNRAQYRKERYGFSNPDFNLVDFITEADSEKYELYHISPSAFNSMNIYEGSLFHATYVEAGDFDDYPRKSMSFIAD